MSKASEAYQSWMAADVAPVARKHGFTGRGPVFRKREGDVWTLFALERRRRDPWEAAAAAADPRVKFRVMVGFAVPAIRPAWDTRTAPPSMYDITLYAPTTVLEPSDGEPWHLFEPEDESNTRRLTSLIRTGLPNALQALGPPDLRAVLDQKLSFAGPLENLSPGAADELLALAGLVGATDVGARIVEALKRPRVPEPERDRAMQEALAGRADLFGPGVHVEVISLPRDDDIRRPIAGRHRSDKIRTRLIADLDDDRPEIRRRAANALRAWNDDEAVLAALRDALGNSDDLTRASAARSLGHLGDGAAATWSRTLEIATETAAAPTEIAEALVLLTRVDPARRGQEAKEVVGRLCVRFPADTRRLAALATLVDSAVSG